MILLPCRKNIEIRPVLASILNTFLEDVEWHSHSFLVDSLMIQGFLYHCYHIYDIYLFTLPDCRKLLPEHCRRIIKYHNFLPFTFVSEEIELPKNRHKSRDVKDSLK